MHERPSKGKFPALNAEAHRKKKIKKDTDNTTKQQPKRTSRKIVQIQKSKKKIENKT